MASSGEGSVTQWVGNLKDGDHGAAQALWERYFERLVRLARRRLSTVSGAGVVEDEEDAALSAFDSFCAGMARGRFPQLGDRDDLWKLLVVITARKVSAQNDRRQSLKRGGGWTPLSPAESDESSWGAGLANLAANEPTPEFAAMVAEETRRLLDRLGDDQFRQIALWRMEGYTNDEIADRLGCAKRTVARRIDLIRQLWSEDA
jgi:DNA-directed RNA polymerase specialized sigma24 family protein